MQPVSRKLLTQNRITAEKDYTKEELEFMNAVREYIHKTGRKFPSWSEVFQIMRMLGYRKLTIPIDTEINVRICSTTERSEFRKLLDVHYRKYRYEFWEVGCNVIRKTFKDFDTAYGIYLGKCTDGYGVGVRKLNAQYRYTSCEIYDSLEDLQFVWEYYDDFDQS